MKVPQANTFMHACDEQVTTSNRTRLLRRVTAPCGTGAALSCPNAMKQREGKSLNFFAKRPGGDTTLLAGCPLVARALHENPNLGAPGSLSKTASEVE
jgi:hypothetical protein